MDAQIVTVFYSCNAFLKTFNHQPDPESWMSDVEVMATVPVATRFFGDSVNQLEIYSYPMNKWQLGVTK